MAGVPGRRKRRLRPKAEGLELRAADDRIVGRPLVTPRKVVEVDGGARWEVRCVAPRMIVGPGPAEAERIGLWRALERVRREGRPGAGKRSLVRVELVRVTAEVMDRVCRWPRLPRRCSVARAAEVLGVSRELVGKWIRQGKLKARQVRRSGIGAIHSVRYPTNGLLRRLASGEEHRRPEWHRSLSGQMGDADWAAARFAGENRSEWVVRTGEPMAVSAGGVRGVKRYWVCPVCGRRAMRLYLPAGPLARSGRTWAPWRWQCRWCTGVVSEAGLTRKGQYDVLGLWLLKMSCGRVGGPEFRRVKGKG